MVHFWSLACAGFFTRCGEEDLLGGTDFQERLKVGAPKAKPFSTDLMAL